MLYLTAVLLLILTAVERKSAAHSLNLIVNCLRESQRKYKLSFEKQTKPKSVYLYFSCSCKKEIIPENQKNQPWLPIAYQSIYVRNKSTIKSVSFETWSQHSYSILFPFFFNSFISFSSWKNRLIYSPEVYVFRNI